MQAVGEDGGAKTNNFIRFDNPESMKSWILDINNEALNLRGGEEEQQNWWSATFDKVKMHELLDTVYAFSDFKLNCFCLVHGCTTGI
jgi:hypothetical protein